MNTPDTLLQARGLNAWYGAAQILYDVGLDVRRGEVVALLGRNGAGKSTTLKALMGLVTSRRGVVKFLGHDISRSEPHVAARLGLGYVPESRDIFGSLTVEQNLSLGQKRQREEDFFFFFGHGTRFRHGFARFYSSIGLYLISSVRWNRAGSSGFGSGEDFRTARSMAASRPGLPLERLSLTASTSPEGK